MKRTRDTLREVLAKIYAIDLQPKADSPATETDIAVNQACKAALTSPEKKNTVSLKALHRAIDLAG